MVHELVERADRDTNGKRLSRREFIGLGAGAGIGLAAGLMTSCTPPTGALVLTPPPITGTPPSKLTQEPVGTRRSVGGPNYESPLDQIVGLITPEALFFQRDHFYTPVVDGSTWSLRVEGSAVEHPTDFSYKDILNMPSRSQLAWIECSGNGRSFFDLFGGKAASGGQWHLGAISVAEWTGVQLSEVLKRAGVKGNAVDVVLEGVDVGKVARPIPINVAMQSNTLLAYALNGETLPNDHGFPLRAIVPGWVGVANIKWLGRIQVEPQPIKTTYNTDLYTMQGPDYPDRPALTLQNIKSAVGLPWDGTITAGNIAIHGFAWSAYGKISKVEYSVDGGKNWGQATLEEPNTPFVWVRWQFRWNATPGKYGIMLRATDEKGNTQPDKVPWNQQGYLYNAVIPYPITVA